MYFRKTEDDLDSPLPASGILYTQQDAAKESHPSCKNKNMQNTNAVTDTTRLLLPFPV